MGYNICGMWGFCDLMVWIFDNTMYICYCQSGLNIPPLSSHWEKSEFEISAQTLNLCQSCITSMGDVCENLGYGHKYQVRIFPKVLKAHSLSKQSVHSKNMVTITLATGALAKKSNPTNNENPFNFSDTIQKSNLKQSKEFMANKKSHTTNRKLIPLV